MFGKLLAWLPWKHEPRRGPWLVDVLISKEDGEETHEETIVSVSRGMAWSHQEGLFRGRPFCLEHGHLECMPDSGIRLESDSLQRMQRLSVILMPKRESQS